MRKLLFLPALLWATCVCAQSFEERVNAHREISFGLAPDDINHCHTVWLKNGEKMVIEMADLTDYTLVKNLDSILTQALSDISFYKDSVIPLESVRIDYDIKLESDNVLMRFKKYKQDGDIYMKKSSGDIARIKAVHDTFRIIIRKPLIEHNSHMFFYDYPMQVTFIMNNYTNLYDLLNDGKMLNHIIDTLAATTLPKEYDPDIRLHQTTVDYRPYESKEPLHVKRTDIEHNADHKKKSLYLSKQ